MIKSTPLLHGTKTETSLDLVTERFFFLIPLSKDWIEWLNTVIYKDNIFWINYWSLTHTLLGFLYGILNHFNPKLFTFKMYLILHTVFEVWELWAGGYLTGQRKLIFQEVVDIVMDTLFGVLGFWLFKILIKGCTQ